MKRVAIVDVLYFSR